MTEAIAAVEAEKPVDMTVDAGSDKTVEKPVEKAVETDKAAAVVAEKPVVDEKAKEGEAAAGDDKAVVADDWREVAANGDAKLLKLLERFQSPAAMARSLAEKEALIRSSKFVKPMPDAKDEKAMAEWRADQGIPADPTGYKLPEAIQKRLVDEDKPILSAFTEYAHSKNARPDVVEIASEWYVDMQEKAAEAQSQSDKAAKEAAEDELRREMSHADYKPAITLANRWLETVPGVGSNWSELRLSDGRLLGSVPEFIKFAADMGRERFGDVVFASGDSERKFTARKEEIEKIRNSDFDRYENEGLDKEYREILEKELQRGKR